jgi:hypothetical protein
VFFGLIESVWSPQQADGVFLFMAPHESDRLNKNEVRSGYVALAAEHEDITITVPSVGPEETTGFILASLRTRELLAQISTCQLPVEYRVPVTRGLTACLMTLCVSWRKEYHVTGKD